MRDALSILDQCVSYAIDGIRIEDVSEIYGLVSSEELITMLRLIHNKDVDKLLSLAKQYFDRGVDIKRLTADLMEVSKEILIYSYVENVELLNKLNKKEVESVLYDYRAKELVSLIDLLLDTIEKYRFSTNVNSYFEVMLIKAADLFNKKEEIKVVVEKKEPVNVVRNVDDLKNKLKEMSIDVSRETFEDVKKEVAENIKVPEDYEVDYEMLLEMLVEANKTQKEKDLSSWNLFNKYQFDIKYAKYANLLKTAEIVAASEDSLILSVANKSIANEINNFSDTDEMQELLMQVLGNDRCVVALIAEERSRLIDLFKIRRSNGSLPSSKNYIKEKIEQKVETPRNLSVEDKVIQLFGQGNVIIKED